MATKTKSSVQPISCLVAWTILGADEKFTPKNPESPATNAQLWRLNEQGHVQLSESGAAVLASAKSAPAKRKPAGKATPATGVLSMLSPEQLAALSPEQLAALAG